MNTSDKIRVHELLLKSLEEEISEAEAVELNRILETDRQHQLYYRQLIGLYVELYEGSELILAAMQADEPVLEEQWWESLAEHEKQAPAKVIQTQPAPPLIRIDRIRHSRPPRKVERTTLYTIIASLAALLVLVIYLNFVPARRIHAPAAALTDSIGAVWANTATPMETGTALSPGQGSLILTKGVAEFLCEDQTTVILEAPAEFEFRKGNQVVLHYGRLYAISPAHSAGFTVDTPGSRIVDLGTEFGVKVDVTGVTEVHMVKGRANLTFGSKEAQKDVILTEKQARRVDADKGIFKTLAFHDREFVRKIDSAQDLIWRGEPLNLADMVGGGNGLGTGTIGSAIDPRSGQPFEVDAIVEWAPCEGPNRYVPVAWHAFIDGLFVPDGESGPVTVTTDGDLFTDCPDTDNRYWVGPANGGRFPEPLDAPAEMLQFGSMPVGRRERPGIFMHTNVGITFDLAAIRTAYPGIRITGFQARCGICDNGPNRQPYADFRVLVDGQERFSRPGVQADEVHEIDLPLSEQDRFLSLVTTDGGGEICIRIDETPIPIDSDWCVFAEPYLTVEKP